MNYKSVNFHQNIDLSKSTFLVTGCAGFIGSHIAQYLLEHNAKLVKGLDNYLTGQKSNIDLLKQYPNFEFLEYDICNLTDCIKACEGVNYISHQAALGSVPRSIKNPIHSHVVNADGFLNMITAARDANVKRFVFASSSSVYGDSTELPKVESRIGNPLSPYAVTKYTNELYASVFARNYGMETIGFRYFNVFGPRQDPNGQYAAVIPKFISSLLNNENPVIDGDGLQTRDFTFIENVVQINIKAMLNDNAESTNKIYNVAVGANFSVLEMYTEMQNLIGTNFTASHTETRKGDIRNSLADITLAKTYLNYEPKVSFKEGLKQTVSYFKNQKQG
jgi:UDP-N-acetylglucosamine/UDP-N-acetylgalactosamine 4-epimerase